MLRRTWFPILLGVVGVAVLLALGTWQLRRLEWKNGIVAQIDARIGAAPVPLPAVPDPQADPYLPVTVAGTLGGEEARVLTSAAGAGASEGPGYRVISVLTTGDRRVLVDLGFVPEAEADSPRVAEGIAVTGNLQWPDETDSFTPDPDLGRGIWFARDVPRMAEALGTEPVLVVARRVEPPLGTTPLPVASASVRNDHFGYAVTWFSLAAVWAGMSALLARRSARAEA